VENLTFFIKIGHLEQLTA